MQQHELQGSVCNRKMFKNLEKDIKEIIKEGYISIAWEFNTNFALSSSRSEAAIQSIDGLKQQAMQACKRACKKKEENKQKGVISSLNRKSNGF